MALNTGFWFTMDNKAGVDLNNAQTSVDVTTTPEVPAPRANLGDRVQGNDGSEWLFVQASTTISQYNAVVIDSDFKANNMTSALVASGVYALGINQVNATQVNANDYFWALLKANADFGINVGPSAGRGVALYISATTPGYFTSTAAVGAFRIMGPQLVASIGTSASNPGEAIGQGYVQPFLLTGLTA